MSSEKKISVHAYKYNGLLYRTWEFPRIVEETTEYICIASQNSEVITTKGDNSGYLFSKITVPTIWYFPKNQWYNLIFAFKKNKYYCYINIAAPFIFEEEAIKYIDLDLDFEIRNITKPNLIELDQDEYEEHSKLYNYPEKLKKYILLAEQKIKEMYKNKELDKYFNIEKLKQYGK